MNMFKNMKMKFSMYSENRTYMNLIQDRFQCKKGGSQTPNKDDGF